MHTARFRATYPECKVLGGKDTGQVLILIDDQHAVGALSGAELARICYTHALRDGESGQRAEGADGARCRDGTCAPAGATGS